MDAKEIAETDVDELWLREWAHAGIAAFEAYLINHAAFAEFLRRRTDLESDNDGSACSV
jgi:hypothetical protein